jgi:hypothetical protein
MTACSLDGMFLFILWQALMAEALAAGSQRARGSSFRVLNPESCKNN